MKITLIEKHQIKYHSKEHKECDKLCFLSKNLYNSTLYTIRQHYFNTKRYLTYPEVNKQFAFDNQPDYRALPAKVALWTQKLVDQNFKSFFALLKTENLNWRPKLPKYLHKTKWRQMVFYYNQALSFKQKGFVKLSWTFIKLKTNKDISFARIVPNKWKYTIELWYKVPLREIITPQWKYAWIDLWVNNLVTLVSNCFNPLIINWRPLKSINQYYNKATSELRRTSYSRKKLWNRRKNKINDYLHKTSRYLVNHLVSNKIDTLVIGYNKEWKQETKLWKVNNQNFVNIPFQKLIDMLSYKCRLVWIKVEMQEESYTSKCSFLDNESVEHHEKYLWKRLNRWLYQSSKWKLINADVDWALNILRKHVAFRGEVLTFSNKVEVRSMPKKVNL